MYINLWTGEFIGFFGVCTSFGNEDDIRIVQWESGMPMKRVCLLLCSKGTARFFLELNKVEEPNVYERRDMFVVDHKAEDSFARLGLMDFVDYADEHHLVLVRTLRDVRLIFAKGHTFSATVEHVDLLVLRLSLAGLAHLTCLVCLVYAAKTGMSWRRGSLSWIRIFGSADRPLSMQGRNMSLARRCWM
jgi:hypothetical protein